MGPPPIADIRKVIEEQPGVVAAYLFGSTARGDPAARDIDLAIMFSSGLDDFDLALTIQVALEQRLDIPVDVHSFDALPVDVQFRVLREGEVIVDRAPPERVHRAIAAAWAYNDFQPYLDRIRAGALQRMAKGRDDG